MYADSMVRDFAQCRASAFCKRELRIVPANQLKQEIDEPVLLVVVNSIEG